MQQDRIEEVSDALAAAWRDGGSVKTPADLWPTSIDDSLAIQDAFDAKVGEEIVGWKIAMTDKLAQRTFGLDHPAFWVGACRRNRFRVIDDWISRRWWPACTGQPIPCLGVGWACEQARR